MCAGCPKNEREPAEAAVKAALGQVAGSWTVSLVKIGRQWSVGVDGPEVKHKTLVVPEGGIKQAIQELLSGPAPASSQGAPVPSTPASRAPAPPTVPPSSTAPRAATPLPAFPPPAAPPAPKRVAAPAPASRAPLPPTRAVPAPVPAARPAPAERAPSSPARGPLVPTRSPAHLLGVRQAQGSLRVRVLRRRLPRDLRSGPELLAGDRGGGLPPLLEEQPRHGGGGSGALARLPVGEGLSDHPRRACRIFRNERPRISSSVRPVRSASSAVRAPQLMPRRK